MKKTACRVIVCLTAFGLVLPFGPPAAAANLREIGHAAAAPVADVALADGILRGQVVDGQGVPRSHVPVTVSSAEQVVQRTATNEDGIFAVRLVRGGLYVISADENSALIRAWSQAAAPPSAKDAILLVLVQNIERGQTDSDGFRGYGRFWDRGILADPRFRVGLAVAAIGGIAAAVVVAVNDSGS